ncbi:MAG: SLC13 family permease [Geminicoccaceae bacterium]|nr:SLC13 family permease [Geminicoccaceae bacterium]MCB9967199.1 SLC13 family permease [Geminicoccaceae bacterium]HRY26982.1 SLC13 family permease [Geminicoccaceae bacterium]
MTLDQGLVIAIVMASMALFLWGRWRHDMVAMAALLACVVLGLLPAADAFSGFGHPAVITVACVLVLSRGLHESGAVDRLARAVLPNGAGGFTTIATLTVTAACLSAFMNNVGALALLMPLAIQRAQKMGLEPGQMLMPLAFGSILGGMTTLIGTPPNLIVAGFRARLGEGGFSMFDFTPVGAAVAIAGIAFILLAGHWLVPVRARGSTEGFDIAAYLSEVRVKDNGKAVGRTLRDIEHELEAADAQVLGMVRNDVRLAAPEPYRQVQAGDVLVIEANPEPLAEALSALDLEFEETRSRGPDNAGDEAEAPAASDGRSDGDGERPRLAEFAVLPTSPITGRSATDLHLRRRWGINLLAVSRRGERNMRRLRNLPLRVGDVLLLQGATDTLGDFASQFNLVPLAERSLRLPSARSAATAAAIMAGAVILVTFGLLPAAVAFAGGVLAAMLTNVVPPRSVYQAIDWPVIVLLAALIPVAGAMAETGAADLLAGHLVETVAQGQPVVALVLILVVTMFLSDFMNNAATAAVMCPIAIGTAAGLGVDADGFLMAVAVGASCAFLTPIGHQNNTLILGPGGFRFGDYWRLGLPLEVVVTAVAVPLILLVWPL